MSQKGSKRKITSWVTPTFDDFDSAQHSIEKRSKRAKDSGITLSHFGRTYQQGSSALWVDLYGPTTRDDLAVHKKKIQEVENWLVESLAGMKGRRFLLLSGPAGCGKSATMRVLSKEAGLNLVEWINPLSSNNESLFQDQENTWIPGDTVVPVSQTNLFREFFIRTSKYRSVCEAAKAGNLMLVEDFPNVFLRDPSVFHVMLRQYQQRGSSPVVFVVTDSTNQQSNAKHLFPPDLQQELSIINIQFNAIASSILLKALNRIINMKNTCEGTGGWSRPSREALESLAEASGGDVRGAVNALQFAAKKDVHQIQDLFASSGKSKSKAKAKSGNKSLISKGLLTKSVDSVPDTLAAVGGKDASLFLFRALGKILYCKRDQEKGIEDSLSKHLKQQERLPLLENAEDISNKTAMGASSLSTFLHQNMIPFYSDIDDISQALQHLTDSDILAAEWTGRSVLEDYAASVAIRGLMHANKISSSGGGWRAFTRPQWFSVHKQHQHNLQSLKYEHQLTSLTSEELTTVLVPLQAKIFAAQGKGSFTKTREVGLYTQVQAKGDSERLDEHDANDDIIEDEICKVIPSDVSALPALNENVDVDNETCNDPEEDFRIDEYPDD